MSSILRALKKLEKEQAPAAGAPIRLESSRTPGAGLRIRKNRGLKWGAALIAGGLLTAAGFWFSADRIDPPSARGPSRSEPEKVRNGTSLPVARKSEIPSEKKDGSSSDIAVRHGGLPPSGSVPKSGGKNRSAAPAGVTAPDSGKAGPDRPGLRSGTVPAPLSPSLATPSSTDPSRRAPPDPPPPELLQRADLILQAISWSEDPLQRIAVINSRVVHEGDRVAEFHIYRINTDDVILEGGGSNRKLAFESR